MKEPTTEQLKELADDQWCRETANTYGMDPARTEEEYKELTKLRRPDKIRYDALQYFKENDGDKLQAGKKEHGDPMERKVRADARKAERTDRW